MSLKFIEVWDGDIILHTGKIPEAMRRLKFLDKEHRKEDLLSLVESQHLVRLKRRGGTSK